MTPKKPGTRRSKAFSQLNLSIIDNHLQKLAHRDALMSLAVEAREKLLVSAFEERSDSKPGLFSKTASATSIAATNHVLDLRLKRLSYQERNYSETIPAARPLMQERLERASQRKKAESSAHNFPLALARLFDAQATALDPDISSRLANAVGASLAAQVEELASGEASQARLAYAAASLLPGLDSNSVPMARVNAAAQLFSRLKLSRATLDDIRKACDRAYAQSDENLELLYFQALALLGDVKFVSSRFDRIDGSSLLWLAGLLPESLNWSDGQLLPAQWSQKPAGMVIVDCALPPALRLEISQKAVLTPRAATTTNGYADRQHVVTTHAKEYSRSEEKLCVETERLAEQLTQAYLAPFKRSPLAPLAHLMAETAIRTDDLMFSALRHVWALQQAILQEKPKSICIYTDNTNFAVLLARFAERRVKGIKVNFRLMRSGFLTDDVIDSNNLGPVKGVVRDTTNWLEQSGVWDQKPRATKRASTSATLFCGRPFDRNYVTDLNQLLALAVREGPAHLVVTAGARAKDGIMPTLADVMPGHANVTFWTEPELAARATAPRSIPASLKEHGARVVNRVLADENDPQHFLILHAEAQLRRHFDRVMPSMMVSAAWVRRIVNEVTPRRIICLPGRDWISRMVIAESKQTQGTKAQSFDMQTVFIGPRRRYKTTTCDTQMAIETHSAALFHDYFELPSRRIVLGGSIRYAATLKAAQPGKGQEAERGILFTASPILDKCLPVVTALVDAVKQDRGTTLTIRPHPSSTAEDIAQLQRALRPLGDAGMLDATGSLAAALLSAQLIVTRFSNTGLEAAMLGKPVIAADFSRELPPVPLDQMGVALRAASPEGLARLVSSLRTDGPTSRKLKAARDAYFRKNPQMLDQDIATRIWNQMKQLS